MNLGMRLAGAQAAQEAGGLDSGSVGLPRQHAPNRYFVLRARSASAYFIIPS